MNDKKRTLIHEGARVRVANAAYSGDERWTNALVGTVISTPSQAGIRVKVKLDIEEFPSFIPWSDLDVEQKPRAQWLDLPLVLIRPSRWQYRRRFDADGLRELALSIQQAGLINRLLVFRHEDGDHFEVIAGERRLRALCALAIESRGRADAIRLVSEADWWQNADQLLPPLIDSPTAACEVRDGVAADFREIVIIENLHREDVTALEEARAFQVLLEEQSYTQAELARRLGKSQGYISQRMGLLGLAEEVRDVVDSQEISFTAARAIATLPEAMQPAVAAHVQKQQEVQGDSGATTRKVQVMARQVKDFFDPERWDPPEGEEIWPDTRNRLRLLKHFIQGLTAEQMPGAFERLLSAKTGTDGNLMGKKPLTIANQSHLTGRVLIRLTGQDLGYSTDEHLWRQIAPDCGWGCDSCQFASARQPNAGQDLLCRRWRGHDVQTCIKYIGPDDPLLLSFPRNSYQFARKVESLKIELPILDSWFYTTSFEQYADVQEQIAAEEKVEETREAQENAQCHLQALNEYWAAQALPEDSPFDVGHGQAQLCQLCVNYRPDLLLQALPPCRLAVEPLKAEYSDRTRAPDMGVLVRDDGLMAPRCVEYRWAETAIFPALSGFTFPERYRGEVLDWLRGILRVSAGYEHNNTLPAVLAWLPYEREGSYDRDRLVRWVRDHWQELGDAPGVAFLLSVAVSEMVAHGKYQEPIDLLNFETGQAERWASVSWNTFVSGKPDRYQGWPTDWPTPWVKAAG